MEPEFTWAERKVLMRLWPNKKLWYRALVNEIPDRRLRRSLESLQERGYIVRDEPPTWKRGMKKCFHLTHQGQRATDRLLVPEKKGELFLQILKILEAISELHDDEGERVAELALDLVNLLDTREKSMKVRDALRHLIKELK